MLLALLLPNIGFAQLDDHEQLITVKKNSIVKPLFFSGIINPINTTSVTSPSEGVISKLNFVFGDKVEKDQVMLILDSSAVEKDYQNALTDYLRAKEKFFVDESKFKETKMLFDLGIVPKNEFDSVQSAFNHANVAFLQATYKLNAVMKAAHIDAEGITGLDISDVKAVDAALKVRYNCVKIPAPSAGVALAAPKRSEDSGGLSVGSHVKQGDVLVLVGDMSGIALNIAVTEIDVRDVRVGQQAIITGAAFPELQLTGEVTHIDAQAESSYRSGLPLFPVKIEVKKLTEQELAILRVGMSAKIKLQITMPGFLSVPIKAISKRGQQAVVTRVVNGEKEQVIVNTGRATTDSVEILDGITEGEQIVVPN